MPEEILYPACPGCNGRALARAVCVKGTERTITYECEVCHHRWSVARRDPRVAWARRDDALISTS
jgi:hypothetical protein